MDIYFVVNKDRPDIKKALDSAVDFFQGKRKNGSRTMVPFGSGIEMMMQGSVSWILQPVN